MGLDEHIINLASRCYGVDEHTIRVYQQQTKINFGDISLQDLYGVDEKNKKIRKDLNLIQRRYKIEN